jgi:hypothetical protein
LKGNALPEEKATETVRGFTTDIVNESALLAAGVRAHIVDVESGLVEYPQREFMFADAELIAVLKDIGPGGRHVMPRTRLSRIINEFRLRSEYPEKPDQESLRQHLSQAFQDAENCEDFTELRDLFARRITAIICAGDEQTLAALCLLVDDAEINSELAAIALETLGSIWHPHSYAYRRKILEDHLQDSDDTIRTAAVNGLSALADKASLARLKEALQVEQDDMLISMLESTIEQIESMTE